MSRKRKRTTSPLRQEYMKEHRRIQSSIRRLEKRGFLFEKNPLKPIPKRVTRSSVSSLKKLDIKKLYSKTRYVDTETGEILTPQKGRKQERQLAALKAQETRKRKKSYKEQPVQAYTEASDLGDRIIIRNYGRFIGMWNVKAQQVMTAFLNKVIRENGVHAVAIMLERAAEAGLGWTRVEAYDSVARQAYIAQMLTYLPDQGEIYRQEFTEAMEEEEWWEEPD